MRARKDESIKRMDDLIILLNKNLYHYERYKILKQFVHKEKICYRCKNHHIDFKFILEGVFIRLYGYERYDMFRDMHPGYWLHHFDEIKNVLKQIEVLINDDRIKFVCCMCYKELKREKQK